MYSFDETYCNLPKLDVHVKQENVMFEHYDHSIMYPCIFDHSEYLSYHIMIGS